MTTRTANDVPTGAVRPRFEVGPIRLRRPSRRALLIIGVFLVTRLVFAWIANHPRYYGFVGEPDPAKGVGRPDGTGDVRLYDVWSWNMRHRHQWPYSDQHIEYPPGALPFMFPARLVRLWSYRAEFIVLMVGVDAFGLWGVVRLARRVGCWWGVVGWLVLMPALGPVTYTRIDLVVAVALVWMLERAHAGRWRSAGAWLGFGVAVKLVPGLLVAHVLRPARRGRLEVLLGAGLVGALFLAPFVFQLPDLVDSVLGYHFDRGVQVESTWGATLLGLRHWTGFDMDVRAAFGAYDAASSVSPLLKTVSNLCSYATVVGTAVLTWRWVRDDDVGGLALALFATLCLTTAAGRVYSPQYLIWIIAVAAVALTFAPRRTLPAAGVLAVVVVLSHLEFPFLFWDALFFEKWYAIAVLLVRDYLTPVIGVLALVGLRRHAADPLPSGAPLPAREGGSPSPPITGVARKAGKSPLRKGNGRPEVSVTPHA